MSNPEPEPVNHGKSRLQERKAIEEQVRGRYRRLTWRQRFSGSICLAIGATGGFMGGSAVNDVLEARAGTEQPQSLERVAVDWLLIGAGITAIRLISGSAKDARAKVYKACDGLVADYANKYRPDDPDSRYYRAEPVIDDKGPGVQMVHDTDTFAGPRRDHLYRTEGGRLKDKGRDVSAAYSGYLIVGGMTLNEALPGGVTAAFISVGAVSLLVSSVHEMFDERTNRTYVSDFVQQLDNLDDGFGSAPNIPPPQA